MQLPKDNTREYITNKRVSYNEKHAYPILFAF